MEKMKNKFIYITELNCLISNYDNEHITLSRFCEILNHLCECRAKGINVTEKEFNKLLGK